MAKNDKKKEAAAKAPKKEKEAKAPKEEKGLADGTEVKCDDGTVRKVVNRKTAIEQGLSRYFTGTPCNNGHMAERRTKTCMCVACARAKIRNRHKDKMANDPAYRAAFNEKRRIKGQAKTAAKRAAKEAAKPAA